MTEPSRTSGPFSDAPWDDDDPPATQGATDASPVSRTMLRASLTLLIVSTAVMFLAAVASNNAIPSSAAERIALTIHRASMIAMLLAFFGILFAYRLPMLSAYLQAKREQQAAGKSKQSVLSAEIKMLLMASALLMAWVWGTVLLGFAVLHLITYWLLVVIAAVLANMIVLHKGTLRSFAVGMLMSLLLILLTWRSMGTMLIFNGAGFGRFGFGGPSESWLFVIFGLEITVSVAAGLVCAFYYGFLAKMRARDEESHTLAQSP